MDNRDRPNLAFGTTRGG